MIKNHSHQSKENWDKIQCQLLYASNSKADAGWQSEEHFHNFTEIYYVVSGKGHFVIEGKEYPVQADHMLLINPNVHHNEISNTSTPLQIITLGVEGLLFTPVNEHEKATLHYFIQNYAPYRSMILPYLEAIVNELETKELYYERACRHLLELCILNMKRYAHEPLEIVTLRTMSKECMEAKEYIDNHFKENITLDDLSKLTYTNKYYLVHAFKKYTGLSPISYLIAKRIEEARTLLETTNYSISQIAELVGFSSQPYFSQVFKKITGHTPFEVRKLRKIR